MSDRISSALFFVSEILFFAFSSSFRSCFTLLFSRFLSSSAILRALWASISLSNMPDSERAREKWVEG